MKGRNEETTVDRLNCNYWRGQTRFTSLSSTNRQHNKRTCLIMWSKKDFPFSWPVLLNSSSLQSRVQVEQERLYNCVCVVATVSSNSLRWCFCINSALVVAKRSSKYFVSLLVSRFVCRYLWCPTDQRILSENMRLKVDASSKTTRLSLTEVDRLK